MKSPFKFLDAFTLQDKDAFFGRDQEIETLYTLVFKTPLLLVYGLSGTGKTSIVQCGLASRFDGPDWYPIFIRRNTNINVSATNTMQHLLGSSAKDSLAENVSTLLRKTLRPVYLMFDQFEELFILGKEEEQNSFMNSLRELLDAQLPAKIILIMREEYIGQLYNYEKLIPELFDHRFRVEPMGPNKVKNVIQSSFDKFNIHLADPKEALLDAMVSNINDPRAGITLPYVQVYLDMVYRDAYRRQYGQKETEAFPKINISKTEIENVGQIDNVLERFLDDQIRELRVELVEKFKIVKPNTIQAVLDIFVSEEGTKRPVGFKQAGDQIQLAEGVAESLKDTPGPVLTHILNSLEQARILRRGDENFELAHDSLALVIDSRRSESQRQLQNVKKRLLNAFEEYNKTGAFLNQKQLASFDEYIPHLGLGKEVQQFLDKCDDEITRKAAEENDRLQAETKMAQQKKLARTRGRFLIIVSVLFSLSVIMTILFFIRAAQIKVQNIQIENKNALLSREFNNSKEAELSLSNILKEVDQQIIIMDAIVTDKLYDELPKTLLTLKSLVRNDTLDSIEMVKNYITVNRIFTSGNMGSDLSVAREDSLFQTAEIGLVLHLNTPQEKEFIQVKWMKNDGALIGDPYYIEVKNPGQDQEWLSATTTVPDSGRYKVEVFNSIGVSVGLKKFRVISIPADEVSMTAESEFRTMASGSLNAPGPHTTTFKVGDKLHYWARINSPVAEKVQVQFVDDDSGTVMWEDDFTTAINTGQGSRIYSWHGARPAGIYYIRLLNSKGKEIAGHRILIE